MWLAKFFDERVHQENGLPPILMIIYRLKLRLRDILDNSSIFIDKLHLRLKKRLKNFAVSKDYH